MELTDLQAHVLAYYTSGQGKELVIATRWYLGMPDRLRSKQACQIYRSKRVRLNAQTH